MTKNKIKNPLINKIIFIVLGFLVLFLLAFVISSKHFLGPVDSKNDTAIKFVVEPGSSKNSIAEKLEKEGLIKNAVIFKIFIKLNKGKELYAGTYNLSKSMSVNEIIDVLNSNNSIENESVSVTFIEGKRITDYAKKISEVFGYKENEVIDFLDSKEFVNKCIENYWFITDVVLDENIYHPLEGYLFPDTYSFKKNSSLEEIATKLITTLGQKLEVYKNDIDISEYTVHELLTLASIIELEGASSNDRKGVAGVFYNRLALSEPLGSDVTTYYGVRKDFSRDLSKNNLKSCNGYNTRAESTCPIIGLPVGPICSPSLASIDGTLEPEEHDYYFFVADKYKKTYFTKTYAEHVKMVNKLKDEGLWYQY